MEKKSICGDKYKIHASKKVIYLPVQIENIPEKIEVLGKTLLKRAEFHISLVCIKKIVEKYGISIPDFEEKIEKDFCEFVENHEINLLGYKDEFKYVAKEDKATVVVRCDMANLNEFFDFINDKYSLSIGYPPAHVTLYTLDGEAGIYLIDAEDIENLTTPIPNPIGCSL